MIKTSGFHGSGASLTGDIFVPNPSVFPPTSATVGGNIFIAGGAVDAGAGFIEAWTLTTSRQHRNVLWYRSGHRRPLRLQPQVVNPDQYLPSCVILGNAAVMGTLVSPITDANLGMSE